MPLSGLKQVQLAIIGCLALLALTSPSDAKSFLQTLFGPPKIQTRSDATKMPAFLRAFFSPFQPPRHKVRARVRHRPASVARHIEKRVPDTRTATVHVPAPARARASFGPDGPVSWEGDIDAAFMRDSTLRRETSSCFRMDRGCSTARAAAHFIN